ncbi:hypothetical protein, partial [Plasmodium yoelii yoelii]
MYYGSRSCLWVLVLFTEFSFWVIARGCCNLIIFRVIVLIQSYIELRNT